MAVYRFTPFKWPSSEYKLSAQKPKRATLSSGGHETESARTGSSAHPLWFLSANPQIGLISLPWAWRRSTEADLSATVHTARVHGSIHRKKEEKAARVLGAGWSRAKQWALEQFLSDSRFLIIIFFPNPCQFGRQRKLARSKWIRVQSSQRWCSHAHRVLYWNTQTLPLRWGSGDRCFLKVT